VKKKIIFILSLFVLSINLFSQESNRSIIGMVQDKASKLPVEFATVQLLHASDSSVIQTAITDRKGKFEMDKIKFGNYILHFSFIGYEKTVMTVTVNQQRENIGVVEIGILAKNMNEVVVTSTRKSLLNTSIDRKVYNVTQDIMAQSGTASDILKNIPSVEVDIEGQVSLRGSTDVMILINGRPSPLMGKTRAEVLQQFPANTIERIEVITNPSARYKPDGTSGIINIVLKKNIKAGWNGNVVGNVGNNDRYNGSINMNYKTSKLNLFGNYSIRQDRRIRTNEINREYIDSAGKTSSYYTEIGNSLARPVSNKVSLGTDYTMNKYNSLGISGDYYYRKQTRNDVVEKFLL